MSFFNKQALFKVIKSDCYRTLLLLSYLIAPLPLERHSDLEQNGYDPCKVDVTHNLKKKKTELQKSHSIGSWILELIQLLI